eukprot:PhF_6_TR18608/c0_g1_i2/m.27191/K01800/maiA, GSTZ1; maleylacetoacetate isomerase
MNTLSLTLYGRHASSCSWRVRIILNYKGIPYTYHAIDLSTKQNLSPEYLALNPMGCLPTLVVRSNDSSSNTPPLVLTQSMAIAEYLEETFPAKPMLPSSPVQRALSRGIVQMIVSGIQPLQNTPVLEKVQSLPNGNGNAWAKFQIMDGFEGLEQALKRTSDQYCVGNEISFADCCLVPQVYNALFRYNVNVAQSYPTIFRLYERLSKEECFLSSHPDSQPDAPKGNK